jgi:hypothetical protein
MSEIVHIKTIEDLNKLAKEMILAALDNAAIEPQQYSKNEKEVFEKTKKLTTYQKKDLEVISKGIVYNKQVFSVVLTYDIYDNVREYHLSVVKWINENTQGDISETDQDFILKGFFGDKGEKITNPSGLSKSVHFIMPV